MGEGAAEPRSDLGLGQMPPSFLREGRGRAARAPRDFALLGDLYLRTGEALFHAEEMADRLARPGPRRHWQDAASHVGADHIRVRRRVGRVWAQQYGGAVKTWQQRLTRARDYLYASVAPEGEEEYWGAFSVYDDERRAREGERLGLTEEGFRLVFACEPGEWGARLHAYRHAHRQRNLFAESDYVVTNLMLGVPEVRVPPQPAPPRRLDPFHDPEYDYGERVWVHLV